MSKDMQKFLAKLHGKAPPVPEPVHFTTAEREAAKKVLARVTRGFTMFEVSNIERVVQSCEEA